MLYCALLSVARCYYDTIRTVADYRQPWYSHPQPTILRIPQSSISRSQWTYTAGLHVYNDVGRVPTKLDYSLYMTGLETNIVRQ